ncbi:ABC transporter substrate-binding protein [Falsiroseomonas sp.]|uniref:ABC transporter substrate-binding protein n=1 Tax=Falsiroseomonas sp. TaxID=2870721 RepID=UPI00356A1C45
MTAFNRIRLARREMLEAAASLGGIAALQGMGTVFGMMAKPAQAQGLGSVTSLRSTSKSWLWAAEDYGVARKHFEGSGLTVEQASTQRGVNHDALIGGAADILLGSPIQNMRVQFRNQPVVLILSMVNKFASNIVIRKEIADRLGVTEQSPLEAKGAALKGLKIGTTGSGGGPDQLVRWAMRRAGLNPTTDAQLTPVRGGAAMIAAMERQQIDGFCLSSPTSDIAIQRAGATYLFNMATNPPAQLADFPYIGAAVTQETLRNKGPQLTAYCRGIALALRQIHQDPADFKAWSKGWFEGMTDALFNVSFDNNVPIYQRDPVPTQAGFQANVEFLDEDLKSIGQPGVPDGYTLQKAYDLRFVEQAMRQLG